jgi:leader peptidase (prepilin peptidase)/N-methyltransferase
MIPLIFCFVLGTIVGSFLNVCIYRIPKGESIVTPRSHCFNCNNLIAWYDNIPLLSYLILGGKCRNCKASYSSRYFLIEFLTGICFMLVYLKFNQTPYTLGLYLAVTASLIVISFIDIDHLIIPDEISLPGIIIGLVSSIGISIFSPNSDLFLVQRNTLLTAWAGNFQPLANSFLGVLAGGGILYLIAVVAQAILKKEAMGGGDIKLLAFVGAITGWQLIFLILMLSSLVGSIVGSIQLFLMRNKDKDTPLTGHYIPFGPYLALASLIAILWGNQLIDWYLNLLQGPAAPTIRMNMP